MVGQTISHYRIIEKLGEGGMGVVYLAHDTKLDRAVALKFLPTHLTATETEKARFLNEAKAAGQLNHPNVCVIHEIQDQGEHPFIVMEYVAGQTIHERVKDDDMLPIDKVVNYAIQIADALQAAHETDIVHRDIKSDNIMITAKDRVKVMDFGLAKLKGTTRLTKSASTVGTLAYMAPEQIQGHDVDARSDIFSFGAVLFEMLTGKLPFKGDYEAALMYEILNEQPQSAESLRSDIPSELIHIINRSLEKDPNDRYQSVSDLLIDLRRLKRDSTKVSRPAMSATEVSKPYQARSATSEIFPAQQKSKLRLPLIIAGATLIIILVFMGILFFSGDETTSKERIPIAVIDFVNQTNETELDGLSGMLITALEQSRRLAVITRSRMFDILDQMGKKDIDRIDELLGSQICKQANIGAMVVASIRKFGKLYTIDLKVVDPKKNEYLFTAKEEAEGQESIPSMLDNLSEKTRIGLKERVAQVKESRQNVASLTTTNLEAFQHFFQGEQLINQLKFDESIEEFKRAVSLDSTFAQAYYRLAYAESWQNDNEVLQKNHLERALKFINKMPERERYLVRATNEIIDNDYKAGVAILKEMEKIYPDDKEMLYNIGDWSYHLDEYTTAVTYFDKTLKIAPNHQRALQHLTWTYRDMENHNKMLMTAKRYVAFSGSGESYQLLAEAHIQLDQLEQGIATLKQARDLFPDNYRITESIADLYTYLNLYAKAEEELKKLVEKNQSSKVKHAGYDNLAEFYPYMGKYRQALNYADKGINLSWQNGDTTHALISHNRKATLLLLGWNDPEKAWKEAEKTFPFNKNISSNPYWGSLTFVLVYRGNYTEALNISKDFPLKWQYQLIRSIIYNLKGDEKNAKVLSDSSFQNNPDFANTFLLYTRAECQYDNGLYDDALTSLKKLPALNSNYAGYRSAYYPKSVHLMGKIFEKKGDIDNAVKSYEKFLDLWKDADEDLPDMIDAKKRYARLVSIE